MERPNHLQLQKKTAANRATSLAIVAAIHVIAIGGLVEIVPLFYLKNTIEKVVEIDPAAADWTRHPRC